MSSKNASAYFEDRSVDMVFIDGSHVKEEFLSDLNCWSNKPTNCYVVMIIRFGQVSLKH